MQITCPNCGEVFYTGTESPLREARMNKGLSVKEAAAAVGISEWGLGRLERGDGNPRLDVLRRLSKLYGAPIEHLLPPSDDEELMDREEEEEIEIGGVVGETEDEPEVVYNIEAPE